MRIFLSYAAQDRNLAEAVSLALRAQGHTVFFDRTDLPPGEEYDLRIRRGIEKSQLFVFLLSPDSVDAGSYTLTELGIAQRVWQHPTGKVLPIVIRPVPLELIPAYLKSVTLLEPEGNLPATIADAVHRIALARTPSVSQDDDCGTGDSNHPWHRREDLLGNAGAASHGQGWSAGRGDPGR